MTDLVLVGEGGGQTEHPFTAATVNAESIQLDFFMQALEREDFGS